MDFTIYGHGDQLGHVTILFGKNFGDPSYTVTIPATNHHDSSRFEPDGKIGMCWDGKKRKSSINMVSRDAPMVSARFIYGSTTTHDGSASIHHGGAMNAHESSWIR